MHIYKEPTENYKYVFYYNFDFSILEFCRGLKKKFGFKNFGFEAKKWRFNSLEIVFDILLKYPYVVINKNMKEDLTLFKYEKEKNKIQEKKAIELKRAEDTNFVVKNVKGELRPYQKIGVEFFINNNGKAMLNDEMGCLSGDTKVVFNRGGNGKSITLKKAYVAFNKLDKRDGRGWGVDTYTRSINEFGEFRLNRVNKILYKGKKEVIKITAINDESGKKYELILTPNHKIMTIDKKWTRATDIPVGGKILTNGTNKKYCPICKEVTEHAACKYGKFPGKCKKCIYLFYRKNNTEKNEHLDKNGYVYVSGMQKHPNSSNNSRVFKHILVMEAKINQIEYKNWLEIIRSNKINRGYFFLNSKKYSIHHIDGDKTNNKISNLKLMTIKSHCKLEGKTKTYKNLKECFFPSISTITKKEDAGTQDVYDIVMEDPYRNFIANGIVVHNSGKSAQALAYIAHTKKQKTLVVCPASVKFAWKDEVAKWTKLSATIINTQTKSIIELYSVFDIFIINYDILKKFFKQLEPLRFDVIVLDEYHYIKNQKSIRSKVAISLAKNIPSRILLSGTPMLNRPIELFNGLHLMDPTTWNSWYQYSIRYAGGHQSRWGWEASGATNIEELQQKISRYFLRRTKDQILPELPPKQFINYPVELDKESAYKYDLAEESFVRYLKEIKKKKIDRETQASKLVKLNELRQIASEGKVWASKEIIQEAIDSGQKILVFSVYNKPLEDLYEHFSEKQSVLLTGRTKESEREEIIEKFQKDPDVKIFFGGIKSAGAGITLTAASVVLFIDYSWTPADHLQAQDRCHRLGQKAESITIYQLYANNTLDENIKWLLAHKQVLIDKIIDGKVEDIKSENGIVNNLFKIYEDK